MTSSSTVGTGRRYRLGPVRGLALLERTRPEGECLIWTGYINPDGYSMQGGFKAYRLVYEHFNGPIPAGLQVDHVCRNKACVRPEHLEAVTHRENQRRKAEARTACRNGHEYTAENTRIDPDRGKNARRCRECDRAKNRACRARRKAGAR